MAAISARENDDAELEAKPRASVARSPAAVPSAKVKRIATQ